MICHDSCSCFTFAKCMFSIQQFEQRYLWTNSGLNNFVKFRAGDILVSFHQSVSCPNERVTMVVSKPFILQCLTTVFTGVILTLL